MMLRTEKQVRLDTVINSSRRSIEHFRWVADNSDNDQVKALLYDLALQRETLVEQLAPQMYKLSDMPSEPDPEKLAIEEMITQIKASFSEDKKQVLLSSLNDLDAQLLQEIGEACSLDFDAQITTLLRKLQESVIAAEQQLATLSG